MFKKILIANRGEIAVRIARTAKALGIKVVAVFSDADRDALHVEVADEAYHIGPAPVSESYLKIEHIIEAAKKSGAEAIHPGYGFLSENPEFVEAVEAAGLVFIGPPASAIRAMGLKDAAKKLMEQSGVPVVPGYHGDTQNPAFLKDQASSIGYPVLIKARAGGGGKGMRRVDKAEDFLTALEGAQREGQSSFGDGAVLIEKYVSSPRHIEVQVFADSHGNAVHLFERDCSLQRRHQKVIEEAPAPHMSGEMRAIMGDAAVKAALSVGYEGAGTVEFIVDASEGLKADRFWFMEMNTRLQVEHPVTEAITGEDLVTWQLHVAAGNPLPKTQDELVINGHAFEARIYAEDAPAGFLPATGTLKELEFPEDHARIDSGVRKGDTITPYYDPMIAKVIVHGKDRQTALAKLSSALEETRTAGTITNTQFLHTLANHKGFAKGDVDTLLIDRELDVLVEEQAPSLMVCAVAALIDLGHAREQVRGEDPWSSLTGWRHWNSARQFSHLNFKGTDREISLTSNRDHSKTLKVEGQEINLRLLSSRSQHLRVESDGAVSEWHFFTDPQEITVFAGGNSWQFIRTNHLQEDASAEDAGNAVLAPMPGQVKLINFAKGEQVKEGDTLVVTEAMKMEHSLKSPRDGRIANVMIAAGDQVEEGTILIELAEET
ncbi:acetyl/propionyl/methylcrotonyl-CoA carboxylase subunit alpha [Flexibacterium corallicola]|uniref:acetyl/propionyl/methylcrotonyl-CoA carboxylase subunit alpha n=1 Tax=Flexibacterium corallicola TaxID=3037259 RepID=UPI00286F63D6|nr:acetyl/propionyl/methylcrotonyl-CoA carboxylase subunit alpha [Pseudovibrio sp. M1P-2-3]